MLKALVVHNHIEGLTGLFQSDKDVHFDFAYTSAHFQPNLTPYDLLIVPNGSDHLAMAKIKEEVHAFLNAGKALFCFDGWFTDWVPRNQWIMDNSHKTIDIRYQIPSDEKGLMENVPIESLNFSHGISGWWSCGYIDAHPQAEGIIEDTWQRPMLIRDEVSTHGLMILTASGPVSDATYATTDDEGANGDIGRLFRNCLRYETKRKNKLISTSV